MVVDLQLSGEITEFSGSSEDDMQYAKTFWQSVQLLPPMESRLVSSDIKQRLKVAPPASQPINVAHSDMEEPLKLQEFLAKAKFQEKAEKWNRLEKLSALRRDDQQLLQKHRTTRIQKERISSQYHPSRRNTCEQFIIPQDDSDNDYEDEPAASIRELDQFEAKMGQVDSDDSD